MGPEAFEFAASLQGQGIVQAGHSAATTSRNKAARIGATWPIVALHCQWETQAQNSHYEKHLRHLATIADPLRKKAGPTMEGATEKLSDWGGSPTTVLPNAKECTASIPQH